MMDSALGIIDQERRLPPEKRFTWTISGWPLAHILGPLQDPARKVRIEQAVREGTLAVQALPFSLHTETLRPGRPGAGTAILVGDRPQVRPAAAHRGQDDRRALSLLGVADRCWPMRA